MEKRKLIIYANISIRVLYKIGYNVNFIKKKKKSITSAASTHHMFMVTA